MTVPQMDIVYLLKTAGIDPDEANGTVTIRTENGSAWARVEDGRWVIEDSGSQPTDEAPEQTAKAIADALKQRVRSVS